MKRFGEGERHCDKRKGRGWDKMRITFLDVFGSFLVSNGETCFNINTKKKTL